MSYKTFDDLQFTESPAWKYRRAQMIFPNHYGISVIEWLGDDAYKPAPYECAGLYEIEGVPRLADAFLSEWGDTVKMGCTKEEVTRIMKQFQDIDKEETK